MKKFTAFLTYILLLTTSLHFSQNEASKWCFSQYNGLDFSTSPPSVQTCSLNDLACASIANGVGNLLFYTNGVSVWNAQHLVMANGALLMGSTSCFQSGLIVKQPGSASVYYIFTLSDIQGCRYSIVDMSLAAGLGSVTTKAVLLYQGTLGSQTVARHANGNDYWIISQEYQTNNFRAYLLSASGLNNVPVISAIGPVNAQNGSSSSLKMSPIGKKLGISCYAGSPGYFGLVDFDPNTGILSNLLTLSSFGASSGSCEFSPDGSKFYANRGGIFAHILQWDLCAGSDSAIIASQATVNINPVGTRGIQLAPDGKIYLTIPGSNTLAVINDPNKAGIACNFNLAGPVLNNSANGTLPQFARHYLKNVPSAFAYTIDTTSCGEAAFSVPCAYQANISAQKWLFGDPASGAANTSALSSPTHTFSAPGTYTVKLVLDYGSSKDTLTQIIDYPFSVPSLSVSGLQTICKGQTVILTPSGAATYTWSGVGTQTAPVLSPTATTVYTLTGADTNGCVVKKTITLIVNPCTSIYELQFLTITIGPNPAKDYLQVETDQNIQLIIRDQIGRVVLEEAVSVGSNRLSVEQLPNGIYFMTVIGSDGDKKTSKLLKIH